MKTNLYTPSDFFADARNEAEVDNLLNNDMYKFTMLDFILANDEYKDLEVKRKMTIRSKDIKTAKVIPIEALKDQLEATKNINGVNESDLSYLRWIRQSDGKSMFREETLEFLKTFKLPDYKIWINDNDNYELEFIWPWKTSIMWEIFGLKIINSLYLYHYIKKEKLSNIEFTQIINKVLDRIYNDIKIFENTPGLNFMEFWTRRSASTDIHKMIFSILENKLPNNCIGTSNIMLAKQLSSKSPKWTNAHEPRMIPTALYDDPEKIIDTMYDIDRRWIKHFPTLGVLLPDTYGSSFYFKNCPQDIIKNHTGCRFDSKDPLVAIPEYVNWLLANWQNPQTKIWIPSDWLDSMTSSQIHRAHSDKIWKITFWIGTHISNNTKGTWPRNTEPYWPFGSFSVVIKPSEVKRPDGTRQSCVKLSDNPTKATWGRERVELFKKIFWAEWSRERKVEV